MDPFKHVYRHRPSKRIHILLVMFLEWLPSPPFFLNVSSVAPYMLGIDSRHIVMLGIISHPTRPCHYFGDREL